MAQRTPNDKDVGTGDPRPCDSVYGGKHRFAHCPLLLVVLLLESLA
jgi:hypothetical protein